jgi:hypothetical protein
MMSKNSIWNKGKRNGGGGPPGGSKTKSNERSRNPPLPQETGSTESIAGIIDPRMNTVSRMNRKNWIERPARVIPTNTNQS